ncbi:hypothetical protein [Xanthomonas prunicola]|nr:hypothetical protein [Xanthomonas prunicola]
MTFAAYRAHLDLRVRRVTATQWRPPPSVATHPVANRRFPLYRE